MSKQPECVCVAGLRVRKSGRNCCEHNQLYSLGRSRDSDFVSEWLFLLVSSRHHSSVSVNLPSTAINLKMSRGSATFQIVSSVAGVAAAYFMYKNYVSKRNLDPGNDQGLDPNWNGQPINPTAPIAIPQSGCQIWNSQQNLFENAGDPWWDETSDQCFLGTTTNQLVRWTDKKTGKTTWKAADPFLEDPALHGTCLFYDGNELYHFPEIGGQILPPGVYPKGGFESGVPPNRSQRLCFNSGESVDTTGRIFVADDGTMTLNPQLAYNPSFIEVDNQQNWGYFTIVNDGNASFSGGPPVRQNQCQVFKQQTNTNNSTPPATALTLFSYGNDGGPGLNADENTCLAIPDARYWDWNNQKIVYKATNGDKIQTAMIKGF